MLLLKELVYNDYMAEGRCKAIASSVVTELQKGVAIYQEIEHIHMNIDFEIFYRL